MDATHPSLIRVISSAVDQARSAGRDYVGVTERAIRAVQAVEPDLAMCTVRRLVEQVRRD